MRISHEYNFVNINPKTGTKTIRDTLDQIDNVIKSMQIQNHLIINTLQHELKEEFDDKGWIWDDYFKFTFVRNTWARQVSLYSYKQKMAHEWKHGLGKFSKKIPTDQIQGKRCDEFIKKSTLKDAIKKLNVQVNMISFMIRLENNLLISSEN